MELINQTAASEFLLLGLTEDPALPPLIFSFFLSMYLVTILGNLLTILAVSSDPHFHTPMYYFLSNLSFTDICISTTTIPKMLVNIQAQDQGISYTGCLSQVCFVLIFGGLESCLLAVMAYDRYVAICHPLRYTTIMSPRLCVLLALLCLLVTTVNALLHSLMVLRLSFCTALEIPHFFCELVQLIKLACSDTHINNLLVYLVAGLFAGVPLAGIIFSYVHINNLLIYSVTSLFAGIPLSGIIFSYTQIVSSVLRMPSVAGRYKAFSTCGSHLLVVSLFYGTAFGVYMSSAVSDSSIKNVVASMMYIVVPQMLNPFIYSLRNKEMKGSLRHLIAGIPSL